MLSVLKNVRIQSNLLLSEFIRTYKTLCSSKTGIVVWFSSLYHMWLQQNVSLYLQFLTGAIDGLGCKQQRNQTGIKNLMRKSNSSYCLNM